MIIDEVQTNLDDYLEAYERIRERVKDEHVASMIFQELAKDARTSRINGQRSQPKLSSGVQPITEKQKAFLAKLGVRDTEKMSKQEASALLDRLTGETNDQQVPQQTPMNRRVP
ncbi:MAG: hypothetical protein IT445_18105 [Phycisphaeraceae bacterium]|nr:hypothetical protein [Phycisphaeraceae bacterium]